MILLNYFSNILAGKDALPLSCQPLDTIRAVKLRQKAIKGSNTRVKIQMERLQFGGPLLSKAA